MSAHLGLTGEQRAILDLVSEIARREVAPRAEERERAAAFPREVFQALGRAGVLALPYPEDLGGGGQPYGVYLRAVEELARAHLAVAVGVSVQNLTIFPIDGFGDSEQRARWIPPACAGDQLGSYCLSEPGSGSDAASLVTRARREGGDWVIDGTKSWVTHGGESDYYVVMARTGEGGPRGITAFFVPGGSPGLSRGTLERKMGMRASPTAQMIFDGVRVPEENRIGEEGEGFAIAMRALDAGRLGIAACSVGLASAALEAAVAFTRERRQFGRPVISFQGIAFLLADMATSVEAARALTLSAAARRDAGEPFAREAAMAKLFASDAAMRVTTDAVQAHGGYGYVEEFPVERYMREAKLLQIVEGTNQVQRLVISRSLAKG
ncbi:MAG: acyl-CoA dehydrogenase family protein, partial [Acidobacteria bacterium]|nr:acyl-CoA dehydrogenase family protein [Acidobacteriota bacterium]